MSVNRHAAENAALKVRLLAELAALTPGTAAHFDKHEQCRRMGYAPCIAYPVSAEIHDGPGGDQFCVFCLRKRAGRAEARQGRLRTALLLLMKRHERPTASDDLSLTLAAEYDDIAALLSAEGPP